MFPAFSNWCDYAVHRKNACLDNLFVRFAAGVVGVLSAERW